jgi:hypothetical protein
MTVELALDLVQSCPEAARHLSVRRHLRKAIVAGDLPMLRAFSPAAVTLFDEYDQWRAESQRDVPYQGDGWSSDALPCEPLVRLLLDAGADKEFLLGQAAQSTSAAFARVLLERCGASGLVPLLGGPSARDLGVVSSPAVAALFRPLGAALGRYQIQAGNPVHSSGTSRVHYARDVFSGEEVALKFMRNGDEFERELSARGALDGLERPLVVRITACHGPKDYAPPAACALLREEPTPPGDERPFLLVMEKAGESLHHFLSSQRVAGYDLGRVARLAASLASQLRRLHTCGLVHFDVKARNALLSSLESTDASTVHCFFFSIYISLH